MNKPIINLKTQIIYKSISQAAERDGTSKNTIKISCSTGKKLSNDSRYAYLDLYYNPILTKGHKKDNYIGKIKRKVKELISGIIYNNAQEAAKEYNLSSIYPYAEGRLLIAKNKYVFCYLDENNNEVITKKHKIALKKIKEEDKNNYIAWDAELSYETAKYKNKILYFKSIKEFQEVLSIKNISHLQDVLKGKRYQIEGYKIAEFDQEIDKPILTKKHFLKSKKIIRKVICLNDQKIYNNCSQAAAEYCVDSNKIGQCAKGTITSILIKNKSTGKDEFYRFCYFDKHDKSIPN